MKIINFLDSWVGGRFEKCVRRGNLALAAYITPGGCFSRLV